MESESRRISADSSIAGSPIVFTVLANSSSIPMIFFFDLYKRGRDLEAFHYIFFKQ